MVEPVLVVMVVGGPDLHRATAGPATLVGHPGRLVTPEFSGEFVGAVFLMIEQ